MRRSSGKSKRGSALSAYSQNLGNALSHRKAKIAEHAARVEAEQASRMKSSFIANMSHELRTPLNAIIGFSKLIQRVEHKELSPAEIAEFGGYIHEAADHLLGIVNSILNISKIESGTTKLDVQDVSLTETIASAVKLLEPKARESGIVVRQHFDPDLSTMRGDPVRLKQVYINLLSNAVKFTPEGGSISVNVKVFKENKILVTVGDTGIGMSESELQVALSPFGQVDNNLSRKQEGTGLGLAIAKGLVEQHGGRLEISSEKGKGTVVATVLPVVSEKSSGVLDDQVAA